MKTKQFLGWFKKAYPDIGFTEETKINYYKHAYILSTGTSYEPYCTLVYNTTISNVGIITINNPEPITDDAQIVITCRNLFGEPKVIFQGIADEVIIKEKQPIKKEINLNSREDILNFLNVELENKVCFESEFGKIHIIDGPVLGSLGLSPSKEETYKFIPYSEKDKIKEIILNFINNFKTTNQ